MWPFNYCISRINNTQVDDAHDNDVIMSTFSLIEYSNDYSETFKTLQQYCRDDSAISAGNGDIVGLKKKLKKRQQVLKCL